MKLREALKEKVFFMKELNHRVINNLAIVSSLISLKDSEIDDDLSDLKHRIVTVLLVHEKLHQYGEVKQIKANVYIHEILGQEVAIVSNIEDVSLHPRTLVPLGIVINEIATNTIKYGFTDYEEAGFSVNMRKDPDNEHYIFTLSNTSTQAGTNGYWNFNSRRELPRTQCSYQGSRKDCDCRTMIAVPL